MGSAASVKNYCENLCCPEETKSLNSLIENSSYLNQEKGNPSNEQDNSYYNKTITNLIVLKNKDNNMSESSINNENKKEKIELIEKEDEKKIIIKIIFLTMKFIKRILPLIKKIKKFYLKVPKKTY